MGESAPSVPDLDCQRCPRLAAFRSANRQAYPNYFNAPVPSFGGYAVYSLIRRLYRDDTRGIVAGSMLAAWLSVMAAACLFCIEFAVSHRGSAFDMPRVLALMVAFHAVVWLAPLAPFRTFSV